MRVFLLVISFCLFSTSFSQGKVTDLYAGYSVNAYKGDFSGYSKARNAFSAGLILNREKKVGGELNLRIGGLASESLDYADPVVPFVQTTYFSFNYGLSIRAIKFNENTSVHVVPGIGFIRFTPKDFDGNSLAELSTTRDKGEEFSNVALVLPLKVQMRHRFSPRMGMLLETGFLNTRTDYLDNVSNLADNGNKDNVLFLNFGLSFFLKERQQVIEDATVKNTN